MLALPLQAAMDSKVDVKLEALPNWGVLPDFSSASPMQLRTDGPVALEVVR